MAGKHVVMCAVLDVKLEGEPSDELRTRSTIAARRDGVGVIYAFRDTFSGEWMSVDPSEVQRFRHMHGQSSVRRVYVRFRSE